MGKVVGVWDGGVAKYRPRVRNGGKESRKVVNAQE